MNRAEGAPEETEHFEQVASAEVEFKHDRPLTIVKVGSKLITNPDGSPNLEVIQSIADQLKVLRDEYDQDIILVSSGAVAFGMQEAGITERPTDVAELQHLAMDGQPRLYQAWTDALGEIPTGQALYTHDNVLPENIGKHTPGLHKALEARKIIVANENDAVSGEELQPDYFTDNDDLASLLAAQLGADRLILMGTTDGIYKANEKDKIELRLKRVRKTSEEMEQLDNGESELGRGGVKSKVKAGQRMLDAGTPMYVVDGTQPDVLQRVFESELGQARLPGTKFDPDKRVD